VADTYPPERAADAHRRLEAGGTRGRLVIEFWPRGSGLNGIAQFLAVGRRSKV